MAASLVALSAPVLAQEERLVSTHGAWHLKCERPPGASAEQCWVEQKVTAEDRPQVGLTVVYRQSADGKSRILWMQAPLGVFLPRQLGLKIDGQDVGSVPYLKCPRAGCIAEAQMEDNLLDLFKKGEEALFVIFESPEAGIGIPVTLSGFAEAVAELAQIAPGQ